MCISVFAEHEPPGDPAAAGAVRGRGRAGAGGGRRPLERVRAAHGGGRRRAAGRRAARLPAGRRLPLQLPLRGRLLPGPDQPARGRALQRRRDRRARHAARCEAHSRL